ncbi:GerAB/ArcD/ProY family transporter [Tuberibacillus sp. Marseille-P3662]|uniref:GerAB/ArcD/ProY family transporter n=1 Tax=Tuberibacillus sp. Marseille-P3662 TaxID=1965358 RepID=UPI000A1CC595|nr:endospore germination permease [Tuberibacillus sp. Marseille-P3662]
MRSFEYGDQEISNKELFYAVASMAIGVGILNMPRLVSSSTENGDGMISIIISGLFAFCIVFLIAKLATRFPGESFYTYSSRIVTKPIAIILTVYMTINFIFICGYEIRVISNVAKLYIFDKTPMEVIALIFLLVVIYAVAGSSVALLRLNMMFIPIILVMIIIIQLLNINYIEIKNLRPMFVTPPRDMIRGSLNAFTAIAGFEVILFYIAFINRPDKAPKSASLGILLPLLLNLATYFFCVGVFSTTVKEILYPTIEIAKEIDAPVSFFERFDSLFFTVWIMAIYTTATMAFDVATIAMKSIFNIKKFSWILVLAPMIYLVAMAPQTFPEIETLGVYTSILSFSCGTVIPLLLLLIAKVRGVKSGKTTRHEKS